MDVNNTIEIEPVTEVCLGMVISAISVMVALAAILNTAV